VSANIKRFYKIAFLMVEKIQKKLFNLLQMFNRVIDTYFFIFGKAFVNQINTGNQ